MTIRGAADAVTIVVGVLVLFVLGVRYLGPDPVHPTAATEGARLDAALGIDFAPEGVSRTLVMFLSEDCVFCEESMPLYRDLTSTTRPALQFVVAAHPRETGIGDYLASEGVRPDSVVFIERARWPVPGTPSLLMVDEEGVVTHAWVGRVSGEREEEVLRAVSG